MKDTRYITLLSVISCISVIILHANGCFWSFAYERYWITADMIESLFYFAVPIFFMISGATLIDYPERYSTKQYLAKRMKKIGIPLLFWSIIAFIYYAYIRKTIHLENVNIPYLINGLMNYKFLHIYWFLIYQILIYLYIPLFAFIQKEYKKQVLSYFAFITFLLVSFFPFICSFSEKISWPLTISIGQRTSYLMYPVIGYLLSHYSIDRKWKITIYILGMLGLFMHVYGTYIYSWEAGKIISLFKGYSNLPCAFYSIAVFLFFKEYGNKLMDLQLIKHIVSIIGKYTFSIYLMHWYLLETLLQTGIDSRSMIYRIGAWIIVVPVCIFIASILKKIPLIKETV